jgi:hypothetical protein
MGVAATAALSSIVYSYVVWKREQNTVDPSRRQLGI